MPDCCLAIFGRSEAIFGLFTFYDIYKTRFSVAKVTLHSQMSVILSVCNQNPKQLEIIILHHSSFILWLLSFSAYFTLYDIDKTRFLKYNCWNVPFLGWPPLVHFPIVQCLFIHSLQDSLWSVITPPYNQIKININTAQWESALVVRGQIF